MTNYGPSKKFIYSDIREGGLSIKTLAYVAVVMKVSYDL